MSMKAVVTAEHLTQRIDTSIEVLDEVLGFSLTQQSAAKLRETTLRNQIDIMVALKVLLEETDAPT